jgi:hypothetical protein
MSKYQMPGPCITTTQAGVHQFFERLALPASLLLLHVGFSAPLKPYQRFIVLGTAVTTIIVDGWLLGQWKRGQ